MINPNEYSDAEYLRASTEICSAIESSWLAGAELQNIEDDITNGLDSVGLSGVNVSIFAEEVE